MTTEIQKAGGVKTFQEFLAVRMPHISSVLPRHMTAERVIKIAMLAYSKTPALRECSMDSVFQSVLQAAELGLEPGGALGHAYLVPYKGKCTLIPGYRGLIELARRTGEIESIEAHIVYGQDKFTLKFGLSTVLEHEPFLDGDPGEMRFVYAVAKLKGGAYQLEVMTKAQVDGIRSRSKSSGNGPWQTDYLEMARKSCIRRLCKYLPLSPERAESLARAIEVDDSDIIDAPAVEAQAEEKAQSRSAQVLAALKAHEPYETPLSVDAESGGEQ